MLKTDDLEEYQSIKAIVNYCSNKFCNDCKGCIIEEICDCMSEIPGKIDIKYEKNEKVTENDE